MAGKDSSKGRAITRAEQNHQDQSKRHGRCQSHWQESPIGSILKLENVLFKKYLSIWQSLCPSLYRDGVNSKQFNSVTNNSKFNTFELISIIINSCRQSLHLISLQVTFWPFSNHFPLLSYCAFHIALSLCDCMYLEKTVK